ncbi:MAG: 3'-5' exonuclease [Myxococcales bacterium]|nr:MAG: 3'-5' exonuclease [Myxococcales bacterium]
MRGSHAQNCGCFPTGHHYPGIEDSLAAVEKNVEGLVREFDPAAPWVSMPFCVIDFETTGRFAETDRVVEVGIVCFENGECTERHNWLVNPTIPVPKEAEAVHGISDADLADAPKWEEIQEEVIKQLSNRLVVAYNASFDRGFLFAEVARTGQTDFNHIPALRQNVQWIDPLVWARELFKYQKGKKLTDMAQRLNIPLENAHRASGDAEAAGRVLLAMAPKLPESYGELIRLQVQYAARQEMEFASWRARRR